MSFDRTTYQREYYRTHKEHIMKMAMLRKRDIHKGYTHDCGDHFDNASEAWVHMMIAKCEPLFYRIF